MNIAGDAFTETPFYQHREAAILGLLKPASLARPVWSGLSGEPVYDFTAAIHYAGCVAGSVGLPLASPSVASHINLLYQNADEENWPRISRLLSELYARAHTDFITRLEDEFVLDAMLPPVLSDQTVAELREKALPAPPPVQTARKARKALSGTPRRS